MLKPGDKLVVYDIDDELFGLFEPPIPEFARVIETFGQAQAARGGDRCAAGAVSTGAAAAGGAFATPFVAGAGASAAVKRSVSPRVRWKASASGGSWRPAAAFS